MKIVFALKNSFKNFCFLFAFILILIYINNFQIVKALPMENFHSKPIVEELRLKVPSDFKEVWLNAEKKIWDPWLSAQDGYLGREIFWDKEKEEALILVNWKNKKLWKSISMEEVNEIQKEFENEVKISLNVSENPFKLIFEGELERQL